MWKCSCPGNDENWRDQEEQFCPACGDAKPWKPSTEMIARFLGFRRLVQAGRYSEEIERREGGQEVS